MSSARSSRNADIRTARAGLALHGSLSHGAARQPGPGAVLLLGIAEIADHYARIAESLPEPPILVGHSFGGLIVELLLDRGIGVAGVAIDPAPPRGVLATPRAVLTGLPVLFSWRGWSRVHTMSEKNFRSGFANGLTPEQQTKHFFLEHVVPAPGRIVFQDALGIGTKIRYDNPDRAPLLLIGGTDDRTVPVGMVRSNYEVQASDIPDRVHRVSGPRPLPDGSGRLGEGGRQHHFLDRESTPI